MRGRKRNGNSQEVTEEIDDEQYEKKTHERKSRTMKENNEAREIAREHWHLSE